MTAPNVSIQDVLNSDAGMYLFNGVTQMQLVHTDGRSVFFSQRREITRRFIGMLLEGGIVPSELWDEV